jgi:hypothetical protein
LACSWELKRREAFAAAEATGALPNASNINMAAAMSLFLMRILLVSVTENQQVRL